MHLDKKKSILGCDKILWVFGKDVQTPGTENANIQTKIFVASNKHVFLPEYPEDWSNFLLLGWEWKKVSFFYKTQFF